MLIRTIRKRFQAFETKLEPFERDSKLLNPTSNIRKKFEAIECKFEPFEWDRSISMLILTIRKRFQAFKTKFEPFERDSKLSNPTSNHSKGIRTIQMQILTI